MIIFDIGAGDGKKCITWLEKFKDCLIYAFEPDPIQFKKLEETRNSAKKEFQNRFKIYNVAVWDSNGEVDFYVANDKSSSSVLPFVTDNIKKWKYPPGRYYFKTEEKIKVQSMRLDNVCKREQIKIIDFMRVDAQGCGTQIFKGLGKMIKYVKEIYLKVHVSPIKIYKGQSTREEIENLIRPGYFDSVHIEAYSREQEAWIRYHSDVWKRIRNSRIYNLE